MSEQPDIISMGNYIDAIKLREKTIEPSRANTKILTRNLQLGNIKEKDWIFAQHQFDKSLEMTDFPFNEGGWLTEEIGQRNLQKIEGAMVLSGSKDGFVRTIEQTQISDQTIKDTSKKSFFGGSLFGGG